MMFINSFEVLASCWQKASGHASALKVAEMPAAALFSDKKLYTLQTLLFSMAIQLFAAPAGACLTVPPPARPIVEGYHHLMDAIDSYRYRHRGSQPSMKISPRDDALISRRQPHGAKRRWNIVCLPPC